MSDPNARVQFIAYDSTGRIQYSGDVPEFMYYTHQVAPDGGGLLIGTADATTMYVSEKRIVSRPTNPAVQNDCTLTDLPIGSSLTIDGELHSELVHDGSAELSFAIAGEHTVTVSCWPYLDATFKMTSK